MPILKKLQYPDKSKDYSSKQLHKLANQLIELLKYNDGLLYVDYTFKQKLPVEEYPIWLEQQTERQQLIQTIYRILKIRNKKRHGKSSPTTSRD